MQIGAGVVSGGARKHLEIEPGTPGVLFEVKHPQLVNIILLKLNKDLNKDIYLNIGQK